MISETIFLIIDIKKQSYEIDSGDLLSVGYVLSILALLFMTISLLKQSIENTSSVIKLETSSTATNPVIINQSTEEPLLFKSPNGGVISASPKHAADSSPVMAVSDSVGQASTEGDNSNICRDAMLFPTLIR